MRKRCSKHSAWAWVEWVAKSNPVPILALVMGALHHAAISRCGVQGLHGSQELIGSDLTITFIKPDKVNTSQITLFALCSLILWHFQWAAWFLSKRRREIKRHSVCYQHCCCCWDFNMLWTSRSEKLCRVWAQLGTWHSFAEKGHPLTGLSCYLVNQGLTSACSYSGKIIES